MNRNIYIIGIRRGSKRTNGVPIYQRVHEDEQESVEVSPLRKYRILPVEGEAAAPNYHDGDRLIYFTRKVPSSLGCRGDPSFRGSARCDFNNLLKLEERPGDPADGCSPIKV